MNIKKPFKKNDPIFFIKETQYTRLHVYHALQNYKKSLYYAMLQLDMFEIKVMHYNNKNKTIIPVDYTGSSELYNMSSNIFIGYARLPVTFKALYHIHTMDTYPLKLVCTFFPDRILTPPFFAPTSEGSFEFINDRVIESLDSLNDKNFPFFGPPAPKK
jgi:hypothetical protein